MKSISEKAKLLFVDCLDENEFEAHDIMAHTGHWSESSMRAYRKKCAPKKRHQMSEALAKNLIEGEQND